MDTQTPQVGQSEVGKVRTGPRDFFLHLGIIVALYVSAVSVIALLFQVIDTAFPDRLNSYYYGSYTDGIRFAIASLIIFFPVYIFLGWFYNRDLQAHPERKNLAIRRWLVYFTLFITGLTIVIDLVVLLNSFLGGEITTRFILKVFAVLVVAGFIFTYYILNLKGVSERGNMFKGFALGAVVFVVLVLGSGFYFLGSPMAQRDIRFDLDRTYHLQNIQSQVLNYWQLKETLPTSLIELNDDITGYMSPTDPETGEVYEYRLIGPLSFELCANFSRESADPKQTNNSIAYPGDYHGMRENNWNHEAGRQCFTRTIDPERYPPVKARTTVEKPTAIID